MEFYQVIEKRRTIRDFENESISSEIIEKIINAGFHAPTNDHMRDWHFIVISDKNLIKKLFEKVPKSFSEKDMQKLIKDWNLSDLEQQNCYRNAVPKQYKMLIDASAIIIPLFKQKTNILQPENISHLNGFASIWCSIENIFLAATAENLGCSFRIPLGDEYEYAKKILNFPDEYCMPCFIGIGKPKKDIPLPKQKNIDFKTRIHQNEW